MTGDNVGPSRGFAQSEISALPSRARDKAILAALKGDPRYTQSLELLGYEDLDP